MDWTHARDSARRAEDRQTFERETIAFEVRTSRDVEDWSDAWNAWPRVWKRVTTSLASETFEDLDAGQQDELCNLVSSAVIRISEEIARTDSGIGPWIDRLREAAARFDPSCFRETEHEISADAVKILADILLEIHADEGVFDLVDQLLRIEPLPSLTNANLLKGLLNVAYEWPVGCHECHCLQPPESFDRQLCPECQVEADAALKRGSDANELPDAESHGADASTSTLGGSSGRRTGYKDRKMEERDRWIYENRKAGKQNHQIIEELGEIFAQQAWEHLSTSQGIRDAVNRFCRNTEADPLDVDRGGRPKGQNRKV